MFNKYQFLLWVAFGLSQQSISQTPKELPHLGKDPIKTVIGAMTLDEKIRTVVGTSQLPNIAPQAPPDQPQVPPIPGGVDFAALSFHGRVSGAAGESYAIPRLGIPAVVYADGPAGLRIDPERTGIKEKFYCTAFPVASLLASSWDTALVHRVGEAMGNEALHYGVDVLLAPGMNIHRNPLTGRNFEYYSEDPIIAGSMAASMIRGIQSNGVGTSVKHFAANNQETFRNGINAIISQRALREIYLKGFSIAIKEGHPWTVMSSYNRLNGQYTSQSDELLTKLLRNDWNFTGFVMSDWWAGIDPIAQLKAGNDLIMPGMSDQIEYLKKAVKSGKLSMSVIDRNVERILTIVMKTPAFKNYRYDNLPDLKLHAQVARAAAAEGMVLLKNESNVLPINNGKKLALFGNATYDIICGGTGSGNVNRAYSISLLEGFINTNMKINEELSSEYQKYLKDAKGKLPKETFWQSFRAEEMDLNNSLIERIADSVDIAIVTIGRTSGEGEDRKLAGDYYLNETEMRLLQNVSSAFHAKDKKVVVVLNAGGVIEMNSWNKLVDGILLAGQPGQEAGNSMVDVITGKVNPSGRLATSIPKDYKDVSSACNFPLSNNNPSEVKYVEDIFVGYRYYNTVNIETAYPFGFGLSYTKFSYNDFKLSAIDKNGQFTATITISNNGKFSGKEVVQLYVNAPGKEMPKPLLELKKFAKTKLLSPGESQKITFNLSYSDLASFEESSSAWKVEKGDYKILIGSSSLSFKASASLKVDNDQIIARVSNVLKPGEKLPDNNFSKKDSQIRSTF